MIFFKHSLITITILSIVIWVMPVTSDVNYSGLQSMYYFNDILV